MEHTTEMRRFAWKGAEVPVDQFLFDLKHHDVGMTIIPGVEMVKRSRDVERDLWGKNSKVDRFELACLGNPGPSNNFP